jgi:hypothetical protein
MGNILFGVDIAGIIADVMGSQLLEATITKRTRGERDPAALTAGRPVIATNFTCTGFWDDYTGMPPAGIEVKLGDRRAVLIGDTIPAGAIPDRDDAITIEGATLYVVQLESRDPAAAVYTYQCRDRGGVMTTEQVAAIEAANGG